MQRWESKVAKGHENMISVTSASRQRWTYSIIHSTHRPTRSLTYGGRPRGIAFNTRMHQPPDALYAAISISSPMTFQLLSACWHSSVFVQHKNWRHVTGELLSERLLWPPYGIGRPLYFCPVVSFFFYLLLSSSVFYLFSSPNLSGHRLDVYHTSTHDVILVRI